MLVMLSDGCDDKNVKTDQHNEYDDELENT